MLDQRIKTRIIHKHAIESDWAKAVNFTPLQGEIICYDADENYDHERIKIGDGIQNVNSLPFYAGSWEDLVDKPFYDSRENVEIFNGQATAIYSANFSEHTYNINSKYLVIFDGVEYELSLQKAAKPTQLSAGDYYYLGSPAYFNGTPYVTSDKEYPFCITGFSETLENAKFMVITKTNQRFPVNVQVVEKSGELKQLDGKYLPNNGQSDWLVTDKNDPAYIKNRTHYEEIINTPNTWTFRLDNSGGWVSGTDPDFVKVISENKNITSVMVDSLEIDLIQEREGGVVEDCKYFDMSTESFDGDGVVSYIDHLYIRLFIDENGEYTGKYTIGEDGASWGTCTITANLQNSTVHHLDPKYIKDMYYTSEPVETELVPETTVEINDFIEEAIDITLVEGNTYNITWNGTKYECICYSYEGALVVGNNECWDGSDGNGEPFLVATYNGLTAINVYENGTYTISISAIQPEIHYVPTKYIKDMYYDNGTIVTELVQSQTISGFAVAQDPIYLVEDPFSLTLTVGATYLVSWDGTEYELVCESFNGMRYIGNANYLTMMPGGDIPFAIIDAYGMFVATESTEESHTISITENKHDLKQLDVKYLPILEEASAVIFEAEGVVAGNVFEGPECKKLLGQQTIVIDGTPETAEFIDDGDFSWTETDHIYIEIWDGGCYFGFPDGDDVPHNVKIVSIKEVIKEEYLPENINAKSDWNQNDSEGVGYITNRPFYDATTYTLVSDDELSDLLSDVKMTTDSANMFRVVIDGVVYDDVPGVYGYMTGGYIGVGDKPSSSGWQTNKFGFYYARPADSTTASWGLVVNNDILPDVDPVTSSVEIYLKNDGLKKIDSKYLPDDIATQEYVDTKIVQSDWYENDADSNSYVKNRPMYFDVQPIVQNFTASGNASGYTVIIPEFIPVDGTSYYVKGVHTNDKAVTTTFDGVYECKNGRIDILTWDYSGCPILNITANGINVGISNSYRVASVVIDVIGVATYHALDEVYIPDTIARVSEVEEVKNLVGGQSVSEQINAAVAAIKPKCATITLSAASWTGDTNPWHQVVTVNGATANSKVDLQPTAIQIVDLQNNEITLMLQNDNGVVTAWAIGNKPVQDYTMQVLITEVVRV